MSRIAALFAVLHDKLSLPTQAEAWEIAKRATVTFFSVFLTAVGTGLVGTGSDLNVSTFQALIFSAAAAAVNTVYRVVIKPKLPTVTVETVPVVVPAAPPAPPAV